MSATTKLEQLLHEAIALGASDLFLIPGEPLTMRIGGEIQRTEGDILTAADIHEMALATFDEERMAEFRKSFLMPQCLWTPGGLTFAREGRLVRMALTRSCGQHVIYISLNMPEIVDVKKLRVPQALLNAALSRSGLVVISGRGGEGKSTTAYSVVDYINTNRACHIYTAEDAIYRRFTPKKALIQQHEIGGDAPSATWVFHAAIGQDVDVFFVNLIKDMETLNTCIAAAERRWLVVAESSVEDRPQECITRFVEAYPVDQQPAIARVLAKTVRAICTQRSLPGANGKPVTAYAVLIPDAEMRKAIAERTDLTVRESPMPSECQTMEQAIQRLLEEGEITAETARKALAEIE